MPKLIRLYIRQVLVGFGISAIFVAMLMWLDVMGLWTLITASDSGWLALFMLWFMNGIVFAGVQFAWTIMAMAERGDDDDRRRGSPEVHTLNSSQRVPHRHSPGHSPGEKPRAPL